MIIVARLTSDPVILGYHARLGVIRTFIGGSAFWRWFERVLYPFLEADSNVKREPDVTNFANRPYSLYL